MIEWDLFLPVLCV